MGDASGTASASAPTINDVLLLANNIPIPQLGFGVYKIKGPACTTACLTALSAGYRHIDSAQLYQNEARVYEAVQQSGLRREEVFLTTKIKSPKGSPEKTYQSVLDSVSKLAGEDGYVDLFLVHVPGNGRKHREELWGALERLYEEGRAKSIGVSNFRARHIEEMKEYAKAWPPHVNQIELHPWCQQRDLVKFCQENKIIVQAYSPLATGKRLQDETLQSVAAKHKKSSAQVLIRYALQKGWVPLPKSEDPERIQENANVFDFELDDEDMKTLDDLDEGSKGACFPMNVD